MFNQLSQRVSRLVSEIFYKIDLIKYRHQLPTLSPADKLIVQELQTQGTVVTSVDDLEIPRTSQMLEIAKKQLSREYGDRNAKGNIATLEAPAYPEIYTLTDIPEVYAWGSNPRLLGIIENYIGLPVTFQGVHLRQDFANQEAVTTEQWHLDAEDRRMLKVIIYLSDATEDHGPFEYIPKHSLSWLQALKIRFQIASQMNRGKLGLNDADMAAIVPKSQWKSCPAPAGGIVLTDPKAIFHHGKPRKMSRSALFFVYTSQNPLRPECCTQYSDETFTRVFA
ncbi:phytanoyl-CoA dioxygenase family protein [Calothrix sp. 336/3]|uniref:phytanoyl-CoA dioxygenase family protein n=1 Tax=Calothrix sp. 336/3 TaxID=1337936 RepID=UPI0004E28E5B|nr:phytanoyl-CoA dioxygenase family protein [Calothrix sp. 336/3]AKG21650.1 phytanoyl-CoA dioxygenase (PhyH) [Calothrix sp. 336/3]